MVIHPATQLLEDAIRLNGYNSCSTRYQGSPELISNVIFYFPCSKHTILYISIIILEILLHLSHKSVPCNYDLYGMSDSKRIVALDSFVIF